MTQGETRECRIRGCVVRHPRHMFCCSVHWFRLPRALRDAIWNAYRSEESWMGLAYAQAAEDAEAFLEGRNARDMTAA